MSRWRTEPPSADRARRERFEAVFRQVYEPLQSYARRRTDPASADDVVAEALLVVWRRLDDLPDGLALPWSYGIARRCLANHRRGEQRRVALTERLVADPMTELTAELMSHERSPMEADHELEAALAQLTADDREIVRLWAWEQLQPREIAVVLDITPNAAAIRVHRAKQRLATVLSEESRASGKTASTAGHGVVGHQEEAS